MEDVATAFDRTHLDYIGYNTLIKLSKLRRLTLDKYTAEAANKGLIIKNDLLIKITGKGKEYLTDTGIIDA